MHSKLQKLKQQQLFSPVQRRSNQQPTLAFMENPSGERKESLVGSEQDFSGMKTTPAISQLLTVEEMVKRFREAPPLARELRVRCETASHSAFQNPDAQWQKSRYLFLSSPKLILACMQCL